MNKSQKAYINAIQTAESKECTQVFQRLDEARKEIMKYLPGDFNPDKELEEARAERYYPAGEFVGIVESLLRDADVEDFGESVKYCVNMPI